MRSTRKGFDRNSALQAACGTSIARVAGCVSPREGCRSVTPLLMPGSTGLRRPALFCVETAGRRSPRQNPTKPNPHDKVDFNLSCLGLGRPWVAKMSGDDQSRENVQRSRVSNRSFHTKILEFAVSQGNLSETCRPSRGQSAVS